MHQDFVKSPKIADHLTFIGTPEGTPFLKLPQCYCHGNYDIDLMRRLPTHFWHASGWKAFIPSLLAR